MAQRFAASFLDRLIPDRVASPAGERVSELTLEQLKSTVVADLEDLLNTRAAPLADAFEHLPACRDSIVNYGLLEFSGMCLTSSADRERVAAGIKAAIERHEPRLRSVQARLRMTAGAVGRLEFAISAVLLTTEVAEPVHFDAVLDASTQQYSIRNGRRAVTEAHP